MLNLAPAGQMPQERVNVTVNSQAASASPIMAMINSLFFYYKSIIFIALLAGISAYTIAKIIPPRYTATAQLYLDPKNLQVFENELNSNRNQDTIAGMNMVESLMKVMASQVVLKRVAEINKLEEDPDFYKVTKPSIVQGLMNTLFPPAKDKPKAATKGAPLSSATSELYSRVSIKRAERTYIIDVQVKAANPDTAAQLANSVVEVYLDVQNENRADNSRKTTSFLTSRLDELREKVKFAEDTAEEFRVKNDMIGAKGTLVSEQQLSDANFQLSSAKARVSDATSRYEQITRAKKNGELSGISEAISSQVVTSLRAQQSEISRKLSELSLELGAKHPQVLNARAQMADLTSMIGEELNRIADAMKNDLERAKASEASANIALDKLKGLSATNSQAGVQLRELEREVEASRQLYNTFLIRSRETSELEKLDNSNTRIITKATPPFSPTFPPRAIILLLAGLVIGGGLGVAQAILRGLLRNMKHA